MKGDTSSAKFTAIYRRFSFFAIRSLLVIAKEPW
jgi:hypothetical protein